MENCDAYLRGYRIGYLKGYQNGTEDARSGTTFRYADDEALLVSIRNLNLSPRAYHALERAGYERIRDLIILDEQTIARLRGIGAKSLHAIAEALREYGVQHTPWDEYL